MENRLPHQSSTRACTNGKAKIFEWEALLLASENLCSVITYMFIYTHTKDAAFAKVNLQT
jgi:hypothetical protein